MALATAASYHHRPQLLGKFSAVDRHNKKVVTPTLLRSIACHGIQETNMAVAHMLYKIPSTTASIKHHRPWLLWNTIDRRSVRSSSKVPSAGHLWITINFGSYTILLDAAPATWHPPRLQHTRQYIIIILQKNDYDWMAIGKDSI